MNVLVAKQLNSISKIENSSFSLKSTIWQMENCLRYPIDDPLKRYTRNFNSSKRHKVPKTHYKNCTNKKTHDLASLLASPNVIRPKSRTIREQ